MTTATGSTRRTTASTRRTTGNTTTEAATTSDPQFAHGDGRPELGSAASRLEALFDEHARLVLAICRNLLRDAEDAEDAAQQTFLSAYGALRSGTQPRQPAGWLATIARNECRARARQRMREPLPGPGASTAAPDTLDETIRNEDVAALWSALAELPRQQQAAFALREFSGLSYGELAAALRISEPAVESLLFRARRHVRSSLRRIAVFVLPFGLRDWVSRLVADSDPAAVGSLAKLGSVPVTAKLASAAAGVALVTAGAVTLTPSDTPLKHARTKAAFVPSGARAAGHETRRLAQQVPRSLGARVAVAGPRRERDPGGAASKGRNAAEHRGEAETGRSDAATAAETRRVDQREANGTEPNQREPVPASPEHSGGEGEQTTIAEPSQVASGPSGGDSTAAPEGSAQTAGAEAEG